MCEDLQMLLQMTHKLFLNNWTQIQSSEKLLQLLESPANMGHDNAGCEIMGLVVWMKSSAQFSEHNHMASHISIMWKN